MRHKWFSVQLDVIATAKHPRKVDPDELPKVAFFAIDPEYGGLGTSTDFETLAECSTLADDGTHGGPVSTFPALAGEWGALLHWSKIAR